MFNTNSIGNHTLNNNNALKLKYDSKKVTFFTFSDKKERFSVTYKKRQFSERVNIESKEKSEFSELFIKNKTCKSVFSAIL